MEVVWTAKARARLRELHDFIAKDSPQRALAVVDRLTARALLLADPPLTDAVFPSSPATTYASCWTGRFD